MKQKTSLAAQLYRLRCRWEDKKMGGVSLEETRPNRFRGQGAEPPQSSDYRCLDRIFKRHITLTDSDVFLDVGCGEGRVLTYLLSRKAKGKLMGVELDPDVAAVAQQRTAGQTNIEIRCVNILESADLMEQVTVYYLFNPFNGKIFSKFIGLLEKTVPHPVTLIYLFDYYAGYLDDRSGWERVAGETFQRKGGGEAHYSIYRFSPEK